jgi:type II secretory ATPase GspE/PulE/Tfp pilus assembly ATPase PilB-like protein
MLFITVSKIEPFSLESYYNQTDKTEALNMDDQSDGVILVMGVTGSGKSYFLNQLKRHSAKEGHSLFSGEDIVCLVVIKL